MSAELRFLVSTGITILELLEDKVSGDNRLLVLDTIEALRLHRLRIDSADLENASYKMANEDLQNLTEKLKFLQENLKTELHATETRLQYIGHIAELIKKLY